MAPPPAATAVSTRRHAVASALSAVPRRTGRGAEAPATRRPPLRVVPGRTRRSIRGGRTAASRGRLLTILSVSMVVAALLAVVVGQAVLANGQVKLASLQHQLTAEQSVHRQAEVADARLETPARIVAAAQSQLHMVHWGSVVELPYVSLSVPLPTPKVTPAPAPPPPTTSTASAGAPSGTSSASTSAASTSTASTSGSTSTSPATTTPTKTP